MYKFLLLLVVLLPEVAVAEGHCAGVVDRETRLACYDKAAAVNNSDCAVEGWRISSASSVSMLTGAATCETGAIAYRLFDTVNGAFLHSGRTYISGFTFQDLIPVPDLPDTVEMRISIQAD